MGDLPMKTDPALRGVTGNARPTCALI